MPNPQEASGKPHDKPPRRSQLNHLRPSPTQDGLNGVRGLLVPLQHRPRSLASHSIPPPSNSKKGKPEGWNPRYDHLSACCYPTDLLLRPNSSSPRPDTPFERLSSAKTSLHTNNRDALVLRAVSESVEESLPTNVSSDSAQERTIFKEYDPVAEATKKKKTQDKNKKSKVKKGWNRMWRTITGANKVEDPAARVRRELQESCQRWHGTRTALSNGSAFFDFGYTTQNALGEVRYSRIPTPAQSRELLARLASRSTVYIDDEATQPRIPHSRPQWVEPVVQAAASRRRRGDERRSSDEMKRPRP